MIIFVWGVAEFTTIIGFVIIMGLISPIVGFVYSVTLYTWELILMVPALRLLTSNLPRILIMIY